MILDPKFIGNIGDSQELKAKCLVSVNLYRGTF